MKANALLLTAVIVLTGAASPRIVAGPKKLPHVTAEMQTPGFWIQTLTEPDRVLLTPDQARAVREAVIRQAGGLDLDAVPDAVAGPELRGWLSEDYSFLARVARYNAHGRPLTPAEHAAMRKNANRAGVQGSNAVNWGFTVRRSILRLFPSSVLATAKPGDVEFNVLVKSGLRLAEPVAVLHRSEDQAWSFVATEIGRGWVEDKDIGLVGSRAKWQDDRQRATQVVCAAELAWQGPDGPWPETSRMGCYLAPAPNNAVWLPRRGHSGDLEWVAGQPKNSGGLSSGPLACTPRQWIEQAFQLLEQTYGWGDEGGYGDCSSMIRRIGLTLGLHLPRGTAALASVWPTAVWPRGADPVKRSQLAQAPGGESLVFLPGHVMLVLGHVDGRTYVIHSLYGIPSRENGEDVIARVGRVVVSDLSLGAGSRKGSLLERIDALARITPLDRMNKFE